MVELTGFTEHECLILNFVPLFFRIGFHENYKIHSEKIYLHDHCINEFATLVEYKANILCCARS